MPTFLLIGTHSEEMCPMNNEKARKITLEAMEKLEPLTKRHGVKVVGAWADFEEHKTVMVFEAGFEAFEKLSMEPEVMRLMAINTSSTKVVMNMDEATKILKQLK
jgi:hypothetical protein